MGSRIFDVGEDSNGRFLHRPAPLRIRKHDQHLREGSFLTLDFQVAGTWQVPVTLATVIYEFSLRNDNLKFHKYPLKNLGARVQQIRKKQVFSTNAICSFLHLL